MAAQAGLDPDAALAAVRSGRYEERIRAAMERARAYGVTGTPTFIINGRHKVVGAQPYDLLRNAFRQIAREGAGR